MIKSSGAKSKARRECSGFLFGVFSHNMAGGKLLERVGDATMPRGSVWPWWQGVKKPLVGCLSRTTYRSLNIRRVVLCHIRRVCSSYGQPNVKSAFCVREIIRPPACGSSIDHSSCPRKQYRKTIIDPFFFTNTHSMVFLRAKYCTCHMRTFTFCVITST